MKRYASSKGNGKCNQVIYPEPVLVAMLGRTSTLALQNPAASMRRQIRSAKEWLPPG